MVKTSIVLISNRALGSTAITTAEYVVAPEALEYAATDVATL